jgi:tetratricopeptide (TPR) repeat protein
MKNSCANPIILSLCLSFATVAAAWSEPAPEANAQFNSERDAESSSKTVAETKSITAATKAPSSHFELGLERMKSFQPDRAILEFSRAYLASKTASKTTRSKYFLLIGRAFQMDENERAAVQALSIAHALNPNDQIITAYLAYSLVRCGRRAEATHYYEWLKAQKDKARTTLEILALEAGKKSDLDSAEKYLDVALKQPGGEADPDLHHMHARLLSKLGQTDQSSKEFSAAAEKITNPYIKELLNATLQRIDGNSKKQIEYLKEAGKILPSDPVWHYELADCYASQGDKRSALEQYNLAMHGRFSGRAYLRTITFLRNDNRNKDAIRVANELIRVKPWSSDAHQALSAIYFARKDFQNAEKEAKLAVQLDKYNENAAIELARQYMDQGKLEAARDVYKQSLANSPKSIGLLRRLGDVEAKLKNEPAARQCYEKIIAEVPNLSKVNVLFQNEYAIAQAKLGSMSYAERDRVKALEAAKLFNKFKFVPKLPPLLTLLHLRPGHLEPGKTAVEQDYNDHILLADMLREGGRLDDCIKEYRKAEAINSDDVDLHSFLLNALDEKGDTLGAARENVVLSSKLVNRVPAEVKKITNQK